MARVLQRCSGRCRVWPSAGCLVPLRNPQQPARAAWGEGISQEQRCWKTNEHDSGGRARGAPCGGDQPWQVLALCVWHGCWWDRGLLLRGQLDLGPFGSRSRVRWCWFYTNAGFVTLMLVLYCDQRPTYETRARLGRKGREPLKCQGPAGGWGAPRVALLPLSPAGLRPPEKPFALGRPERSRCCSAVCAPFPLQSLR